MTEDVATYTIAVEPDAADVLPLSELFNALAAATDYEARVKAELKSAGQDVADLRAEVESRLRESGTASHTDAATGINARIETRTTWQVTDREALEAYARQREVLGLIVEVVDEKRAIEFAKRATLPVPGIEEVESLPFLKITSGKGK